MIRVLVGDVMERLKELDDETFHTVVTSPPYWGLRDYGIEGQLGLEKTPEEHVEKMVEVFREVRRVMRKDATLWLNYGDVFATAKQGYTRGTGTDRQVSQELRDQMANFSKKTPPGLKPKDLVGMPWRIAFALQADGWWLRSDIIWAKANPLPESVTDRPTKSHEYIFLLTRAPRYFYDADAVREPAREWRATEFEAGKNDLRTKNARMAASNADLFRTRGKNSYHSDVPRTDRNLRTVLEIATAPFPGAHFATFPPKLPEIAIKAGTSEKGCCPECGAPWRRVVEARGGAIGESWHSHEEDGVLGQRKFEPRDAEPYRRETKGWEPTCECGAAETVPCRVLDPFGGAGTTGLVADRLGRDCTLIELNPEYAEMAARRLKADCPMFTKVEMVKE